jgi:hypothetical protein
MYKYDLWLMEIFIACVSFPFTLSLSKPWIVDCCVAQPWQRGWSRARRRAGGGGVGAGRSHRYEVSVTGRCTTWTCSGFPCASRWTARSLSARTGPRIATPSMPERLSSTSTKLAFCPGSKQPFVRASEPGLRVRD